MLGFYWYDFCFNKSFISTSNIVISTNLLAITLHPYLIVFLMDCEQRVHYVFPLFSTTLIFLPGLIYSFAALFLTHSLFICYLLEYPRLCQHLCKILSSTVWNIANATVYNMMCFRQVCAFSFVSTLWRRPCSVESMTLLLYIKPGPWKLP